MTIFSLQRDEIFSRLSESKPLHIHKTQTHNTQHFVCSTTLLSLSFSLLLVFLLQFRFATTPEEKGFFKHLLTKRVRRPRYLSLFHFFTVSVFFFSNVFFTLHVWDSCFACYYFVGLRGWILLCDYWLGGFGVWILLKNLYL